MLTKNLQEHSPSSNKKKIMVVDDEPDLLSLFKDGLEYFGFEVDAYGSSESALCKYKRNHYDLLLLDIRMGRLNGIDLINEMTEDNTYSKKEKVCFITAFNFNLGRYSFYHKEFEKITDETIRENVKDNPDTFIIKKPISIRELASRLNNILSLDNESQR